MIGVRVLSLGALLGLSTFPVEAVQATQPQSAKFTFHLKCSGARHLLALLLQQQNLAHMAMNTTHNLQYLPWTWSVKSSDPNAHCPPASSILGTFAIINVLVSLIGLVFGNRVVTNKISCGIFGKLGSSAYHICGSLPLYFNSAQIFSLLALSNIHPAMETTSPFLS
jgi:hypothetical protein